MKLTLAERNKKNLEFVKAQNFNALLKNNSNYIKTIANKYTRDEYIKEELIAEGIIGLYQAMIKFVPGKHPIFISFAVLYIKKYMLQYLQKYNSTVYIPANKQRDKEYEMPSIVSLDTPIGDTDDNLSIGDTIASAKPYQEVNYSRVIKMLNAIKDENYRKIMMLKIGVDYNEDGEMYEIDEKYSMADIADMIGTSRQRIFQIIQLNNKHIKKALIK